MTIAAGLIVSRFLHYCAAMMLFGAALFPHYGFREHSPRARDKALPPFFPRLLIYCAWAAFTSGALWYLFTSAAMSGRVGAIADPQVWRLVASTAFGRVWLFRLAVAAALAVLSLGPNTPAERASLLAGSALLVATFAGVGHATDGEGQIAATHGAADAVHVLAGAVWLGALAVLTMMATHAREETDVDHFSYALGRFSDVGIWVVAAIVVTGIINTFVLVGPAHLLSSLREPYGQMLALKLAFFAGMIVLASANRILFAPRLARAIEGGNDARAALRALRMSLIAEAGLGALAIAAAAWLGTLAPPGLS